jgi:hypothetical protein
VFCLVFTVQRFLEVTHSISSKLYIWTWEYSSVFHAFMLSLRFGIHTSLLFRKNVVNIFHQAVYFVGYTFTCEKAVEPRAVGCFACNIHHIAIDVTVQVCALDSCNLRTIESNVHFYSSFLPVNCTKYKYSYKMRRSFFKCNWFQP